LATIAELFYRWRGVHGLGLGDAKLFAASGAWVGLDGMASVLVLASGSALVIALLVPLLGVSVARDTRIPFGPFLAGGTWLVWLYGPLFAV